MDDIAATFATHMAKSIQSVWTTTRRCLAIVKVVSLHVPDPWNRSEQSIKLDSTFPSANSMADILLASIPAPSDEAAHSFPWETFSINIIRSLANVLFHYADLAKESASGAALYSTTTGILASAHGVSHADRALLALAFEERFEGELPPRETRYKEALRTIDEDGFALILQSKVNASARLSIGSSLILQLIPRA